MANYNGTAGNDVFVGGTGNDTAVGNGGNDTLSGGAGADTLDGGADSDTLYSDNESPPYSLPYYDNPYTPPVLDTGAEVDTLIGGDGSDRLFAGYGDNVDGGAGEDVLFISFMGATSSGVTVDFRQPTQVIGGGTITNVETVSWVQGSNFADDINVSGSSYSFTSVFGMGGDDHLIAGYYTGVLDGGDGADIVDGRNSQYLQNIYGGAGDDILYTNTNTFARAWGGDGNDTIYAHGLIHGGAGADIIQIQGSYYPGNVYGDDGDDRITASSNAAVIAGGAGADIITGSDQADTLFSADTTADALLPSADMGAEHDVINALGGDDRISAGYGDDVDGGSGSDTLYLSFGGAGSGVTFDTAAIVSGQPASVFGGTITGIETLTWLRGSEYGDVLTIANQASQITVLAGAGDDVIISSNALVNASGRDGNDRFVVGSQAETFDGGAGSDTVDYSAFAQGVTVNLTLATFPGQDQFTSVENITGSNLNDVLTGDAGANTLTGLAGDDILDGKAGADTMIGGTGNDFYFVDNIADVVTETPSQGTDLVTSTVTFTLSSDVENLTLTGASAINGYGNELANVIIGNTGSNILSGRGADDTLIGANGDILVGGAGADVLDGSGGRVMASYFGSAAVTIDLLQQTASGGDADGDVLISIEDADGSDFNDLIIGSATANILAGEAGNDTIQAGDGDDDLYGMDGADILEGGAGNDYLSGGAGVDVMRGGLGDDDYDVDSVLDQVIENDGEGVDYVFVLSGLTQYTLAAGSSIEGVTAEDNTVVTPLDLVGNEFGQQLLGTAGINRLSGGGGDDILVGFAGDDVLDGGTGADTLDGGAGNDTYTVDNALDRALENANEGTADRVNVVTGAGLTAYVLEAGTSIEVLAAADSTSTAALDLTGNNIAQQVIGNDGANVLSGGGGDDSLSGLGGDDTLDGGTGADVMTGGSGNDTYVVDNALDRIVEVNGGGTDRVNVSTGSGSSAYTLDSAAAVEVLAAADAASVAALNLTGNSFAQQILGNAGANRLSGGGGADTLTGYAGDDILDGGTGADLMTGGLGNDAYYVDDFLDQVIELAGEGNDWVYVQTTASYTLAAGASIELLTAYDTAATNGVSLTGNEFAQQILGDAAANTLNGGGGDDTLFGYGGDDRLDGGTGADVMNGGAGNDTYIVDNALDQIIDSAGTLDQMLVSTASGLTAYTLAAGVGIELISAADVSLTGALDLTGNELAQTITGNAGANRLSGGGGNDTLTGGAGDDILDGGAGNDVLGGRSGADTLTGGDGNDVFRDSAASLNGDTITDFAVGDRLEISDANIVGFSMSRNGSTLTFTGGSLTLTTMPAGYHLLATTAAGGGVVMTWVKDVPRNVANGLSGDFNGDGRDDLLWRSDVGQMSNWLSRADGGYQNNDANALANVPTSWRIVGAGDFNGDGRDDIVWRSDSGQMSDWLGTASGGFMANDANALTTVSTAWQIVGTGDFNGDGKDDLLWRSDGGQMSNWLGQANGGFAGNDVNAFVSVPTNWHIVGTGDFNGDGRDDILWRSDSGQMSNWLGQANGGFVGNDGNALTTVSTAWHIVGTGDFNGDGRDDILWRSDSGQMSNWLGQANGGFVGNDANALVSVPTDWVVAATGDYNGDGRTDIAWRNTTTGAVSNWLGQANGGFVGNDANAFNQVSQFWHIQADGLFFV